MSDGRDSGSKARAVAKAVHFALMPEARSKEESTCPECGLHLERVDLHKYPLINECPKGHRWGLGS